MSSKVRTFTRHYLEMCVAMVAGMVVLGALGGVALAAVGVGSAEVHDDAPAVVLMWMAISMTVPMVWWMRRRGHGRQASAEMAASMFVPTFAVIALLAAGSGDVHTLMGIQHIAMLPSMLAAMLLRVDEYTGGHAHAQPA